MHLQAFLGGEAVRHRGSIWLEWRRWGFGTRQGTTELPLEAFKTWGMLIRRMMFDDDDDDDDGDDTGAPLPPHPLHHHQNHRQNNQYQHSRHTACHMFMFLIKVSCGNTSEHCKQRAPFTTKPNHER